MMTLPANTEQPGTEPAPKENEISVVNEYPPVVSVLVVAPHAWNKFDGQDKNFTDGDYDALTGEIAKRVAEKIGCKALINWDWKKEKKPVRNYNNKVQAENDVKFISELREAVRYELFVLWIHGANDASIEEEEKLSNPKKPKKEEPFVHAVLGCGQKANGDDSTLTAKRKIADNFMAILRKNGINTILASPTTSQGRKTKCANHNENMCQWFRQNGFNIEKVPSVQIEIKKTGFRDNQGNAENTGEILAKSVAEFLGIETEVLVPDIADETEPDEALVEQAYTEISEIVGKHFHNAMEEVGRHLIERFYGGDFKRAEERRPLKEKSFLQLVNRIHENNDNKPSKTWLYNARDLAVDTSNFKEAVPTYMKLGHSHRVILTNVRDKGIKAKLIEETYAGGYTVAQLRKRINEEKSKNQTPKIPLDRVLTKKELMGYELPVLEVSGQQAQQNKEYHKKKSDHFKVVDGKIQSAINDKKALDNPDTGAKNWGFKDWTVENINICTGCSNDCVYCYAKDQAYRRGQVENGRWPEQITRQKDVDAPRKLYRGRIGFPSTHDINDDNIDAYLAVLGKLLKAGNEVLIVSKPRLNCIKRICDATEFFKEEIMFRFTIGAVDDNILKLWEPNAPAYSERREALQYAFDNGFQTSVSVEPMLDAPNIDALIKDLLPYVYDAIWLGTMNHINRVRMEAGENENLKKAIEAIEANQTDDRLSEIYKRHKENSKIKWKSSIKKVVGLEQPPIPGSDE